MNLPAINLAHATGLLKNGDAIYIDADQGKLFYEPTA
jgi:phosphohistidine swiveling domain-containing protein